MSGPAPSYRPTFPPDFVDLAEKMIRQRKVKYQLRQRAALVCLLHHSPLTSSVEAAARVQLAPASVRRWRRRWASGHYSLEDEPGRGRKSIFSPCGDDRKANDERIKQVLFGLLHTPPSDHGINRTSWKVRDLQRILREQDVHVTLHTIARIIKDAGYRWRKARTVLTSNDPKYKEKLEKIHSILSTLGDNERFFSIDEYGPFSIGKRGGRSLVGPGEVRTVPQRQQFKGMLIATAALELSRNQITHFFSETKNSGEMTKLLNVLLKEYSGCSKIYLSWDAASWHASRELYERVEQVNSPAYRLLHKSPVVELAPLPAGAQFLNVIESVFSGMARAIIHNSDYQSEDEAKAAIDRYFLERNEYFLKHPKRAGCKIWEKEIVPCQFSEANNCKDPKWR